MYEYKVLTLGVKKIEETLNRFAREGWRLAAMTHDPAWGRTIVTLERRTEG